MGGWVLNDQEPANREEQLVARAMRSHSVLSVEWSIVTCGGGGAGSI